MFTMQLGYEICLTAELMICFQALNRDIAFYTPKAKNSFFSFNHSIVWHLTKKNNTKKISFYKTQTWWHVLHGVLKSAEWVMSCFLMGWLFQDGCFLQARPRAQQRLLSYHVGTLSGKNKTYSKTWWAYKKFRLLGIQGENNSFSKQVDSLCDQTYWKQNRNIRLEIRDHS